MNAAVSQLPYSSTSPFAGKQILKPEIAKAWLLRANHRNRKLKPWWVNELARRMADGEWQYNGIPITFTRSGSIGTGQHRIAACIKAGVAIVVTVTLDVDDQAQGGNSANDCKADTAADILRMDCEVTNHGNTVAAALRWAALLLTNPNRSGPGYMAQMRSIKKNLLPEFLESMERGTSVRIQTSATVVMSSKKMRSLLRPNALFVALHFLCTKQDPSHAEFVFQVLENGQYDCPADMFREWFITNPKRTPRDIVARFVRMWIATRENRSMSVLRSYDGDIPNPWVG